MSLTPNQYDQGYNAGCEDARRPPRIVILGGGKGDYPGNNGSECLPDLNRRDERA